MSRTIGQEGTRLLSRLLPTTALLAKLEYMHHNLPLAECHTFMCSTSLPNNGPWYRLYLDSRSLVT